MDEEKYKARFDGIATTADYARDLYDQGYELNLMTIEVLA
jgi:hypothetical protein